MTQQYFSQWTNRVFCFYNSKCNWVIFCIGKMTNYPFCWETMEMQVRNEWKKSRIEVSSLFLLSLVGGGVSNVRWCDWIIAFLFLIISMLLCSASGSILEKFLDETANMSRDERAKHLEKNKVGNRNVLLCFCLIHW